MNETKTMKEPKIGHVPFASSSHNVLLVDDEGSSCSTQIWEGGIQAAAQWTVERIERGLDKDNVWDRPYLFAFITPHSTKDNPTSVFDLRDQLHVAQLRMLAHKQ